MNLPSRTLAETNLESLGRGRLVDLRAINRSVGLAQFMLLGVASEPRNPSDTLYYLSISLSALKAYQCNFTSALQMQRIQKNGRSTKHEHVYRLSLYPLFQCRKGSHTTNP